MGGKRVQMSKARNPWLPMRPEHLRGVRHRCALDAQFPIAWEQVRRKLGDIRSSPFSLSFDTSRWFRRSAEQMNVAFKNVDGVFMAELAHTILRPKNEQPFNARGARVPDLYHQHTKSWWYSLDNRDHLRAFFNLVYYGCSYAAGEQNHGVFTDLYQLSIGETKELKRWPVSGMHRYDAKHRECVPAENGMEVLEVVCIPGERPRHPGVRATELSDRHTTEVCGMLKAQVTTAVNKAEDAAKDIRHLTEIQPTLTASIRDITAAGEHYDALFFEEMASAPVVARAKKSCRAAAEKLQTLAESISDVVAKRLLIKAAAAMRHAQKADEHEQAERGWTAAFNLVKKIGARLKRRRQAAHQKAEELGKRYQHLNDRVHRHRQVREHWTKQMLGCRSKRLQLRVRRIGLLRGQEEPAFFLDDMTELDLPLPAIRRLGELLPDFWKRLFTIFEEEAGQSWPRTENKTAPPKRKYKQAVLFATAKEFWLHRRRTREHYTTCLSGMHRDHRQFRWQAPLVQKVLHPDTVTEICKLQAQPGAFLANWDDRVDPTSEDGALRLALWAAGLLRWNPLWDTTEKEARRAWATVQEEHAQQLVRTFVLVWALRKLKQIKVSTERLVLQPAPRSRHRLTSYCRGPPSP